MTAEMGPARAPDPVMIWAWIKRQCIDLDAADVFETAYLDHFRADGALTVWSDNGTVRLAVRPGLSQDSALVALDEALTLLSAPFISDWTPGVDETGCAFHRHPLGGGEVTAVCPQQFWALDGF